VCLEQSPTTELCTFLQGYPRPVLQDMDMLELHAYSICNRFVSLSPCGRQRADFTGAYPSLELAGRITTPVTIIASLRNNSPMLPSNRTRLYCHWRKHPHSSRCASDLPAWPCSFVPQVLGWDNGGQPSGRSPNERHVAAPCILRDGRIDPRARYTDSTFGPSVRL